MIALYIIFIIVLIWLVMVITKPSRDRKHNVYKWYNNTSSNMFDKNAQNVLNTLGRANDRTAIDDYMIASVLENNVHDVAGATTFYTNAIADIAINPDINYNFILDRTEDALRDPIMRAYVLHAQYEPQQQTHQQTQQQTHQQTQQQTHQQAQQQVQQQAQQQVQQQAQQQAQQQVQQHIIRNLIQELQRDLFADIYIDENPIHIIGEIRRHARNNEDAKLTDVIPKAKKLEAKKTWHTDPQNVHDTQVNRDISKQLSQIENESKLHGNISKIPEKLIPKYVKDIINNVSGITDKNKILAAETVDKIFHENQLISGIRQNGNPVTEMNVLTAVCNRIATSPNKKVMETALTDSLADCHEHGHTVCPHGRTVKVFTSLATLDIDPNLGVVGTRELMRNECFNIAARVRDKTLNETSSEICAAYHANTDSDAVKKLTNDMSNKIAVSIRADMSNRMSESDMMNAIAEAQTAI